MVNNKSSWKDVAEFVCAKITNGKKGDFTENEIKVINEVSANSELGVDQILPYAKKLLNVNILDKNVDFTFVEQVPEFWNKIYSVSMDYVAASSRQHVMAK